MLPLLKTPIPGPESRRLAARLARAESPNVTFLSEGFPVFWDRAEGASVWDADGNRFLDLTSGFGVAGLGYGEKALVAAVADQAGKLLHGMGDVHPTALKAELCSELSRLTFEKWGAGPGKVILGCTGGEAVEAALKTAVLSAAASGTGKRGVLAFRNGYHGLGYGALTVTGSPYFRDPFAAQLADFAHFAPYPGAETDPMTYAEALTHDLIVHPIGAILVEPIQGRGGQNIPPGWFLPLLRRIADQSGALLIFDEIFTGWYRTGRRFACDHDGVVPDLVCLGKALTGGFPLSACVGKAQVIDHAWPRSTGEAIHTSTFLGNPLGCRMALESLRLLERPGLAETVTRKGDVLLAALRDLEAENLGFVRARGRGLMAGIDVVDKKGNPDPARAGAIVEGMLAEGVILLSDGPSRNTVAFTPPFVVEEEAVRWAVGRLGAWAF